MTKQFSIVIPVYNESFFIKQTLTSLRDLKYPQDDYEVIVVDDGSTDDTCEVVSKFPEVRLVKQEKNLGRYLTRKNGCYHAKFANVFFLDSRILIDPQLLAEASKCPNDHPVLGASFNLDAIGRESEMTWFENYYTLIRNKVFAKALKNHNPKFITLENFDETPKGTGVFCCPKKLLEEVFLEIGDVDVLSDDTLLLKEICKRKEIYFTPHVKIYLFARQEFMKSVKHLYNRGPKFIEYYFEPGKRYFLAIVAFIALASIGLAAPVLFPDFFRTQLIITGVLVLLFSIYISKSLKDLLLSTVMTPLVVAVFSVGLVKGIFLKYKSS